jgi:uncharacterized protein
MATIAVVVTPKSGRNEVAGWRGNELVVRVTAAPEGGKANAAVCKTIADALGVAKSHVRVMRGDIARHKIVEIDGLSEGDLRAALGEPDAPLF